MGFQIVVFVAASTRRACGGGYRAVAPDMRGFGRSDAPAAADQYTLSHSVGDMVGSLDALGAETAAITGHDWAPWWRDMLRCGARTGFAGLSGSACRMGRGRRTGRRA